LKHPVQGWVYKLNAAIEHTAELLPQGFDQALNYQTLISVETVQTLDFVARYDSRFQAMQETGDWQLAHPWFECFLPASRATDLIPQILQRLPTCFGEGHRVIPIVTKHKPRFLMMPELPDETFLFAALPTGIQQSDIPATRLAIRDLNRSIMAVGGKRYLSGWLETTDELFWQQHFGSRYDAWIALKAQYDPDRIFGSLLFKGDPVPLVL
jgi:cytokinin dehydrogenase